MSRRSRGFGCAIVAAGLIACGSAGAQAPEPKKPLSSRVDDTGPLIELRPFAVPVEPEPGKREYVNTPVTVFLRTGAGKDPLVVCDLVPRVRDAILENFYATPVSASYLVDLKDLANPDSQGFRRVAEQAPMDDRLVRAVNSAIERTIVSGVIVVRGIRAAGAAGAEPGAPGAIPLGNVVPCETSTAEAKGKAKEKKDAKKKDADKEKPKAKH